MNITIRKCMISDAQRIREISKKALGFDYPQDKFEENIRRLMASGSNCIFVAENNETFIGYCHVCDFDVVYGPKLSILRAIAVEEEYRRYGTAKKLLEAAEAWSKRHGSEGMRIYGGSERTAANAFYKSCGYDFVKPESKFKKDF